MAGLNRLETEKRRRLMVVDSDRAGMDAASRILGMAEDMTIVGTATSGTDALTVIADYKPDIVFLDHGLVRPGAIETAQKILKVLPKTWIFITTPTPSMDLWQEIQEYGIRSIIKKPIVYDEVVQAILRCEEEDKNPKKRTEEAKAKILAEVSAKSLRKEVIAVFSAKGGVGKTTLAVNLATMYAKTGKVRVALVDFDLGTASLTSELGMPANPEKTLLSWTGVDTEGMSDEEVDDLLLRQGSGLFVLPAPTSVLDRLQLDPDLFQNIVSTLNQHFDIVLYDLPTSGYDKDHVLAVLKEATAILLVITPDTSAIAAMHEIEPLFQSEAMRNIGIDPTRIHIVINRRLKKGGHDLSDILHVARFPVIGMPIPEEPLVRRHSNVEESGRAAIELLDKTPWGISLRSVARAIVPLADLRETRQERRMAQDVGKPQRRGLFSRKAK